MTNGQQEKGSQLKKKFIPLLILLLVIAVSVIIYLFRDRVTELGNYGYLGAFLVSLASNATVIIPVPVIVIIVALGATFNPALIGLASGAGAAIGEITGYMVGYSGRGVIENRRQYERVVKWLRRWGAMAIFTFSLVPFLPFDLAGIAAGALRFPFWKFLLVCWVGRTLLYIGAAYIGLRGWGAVLPYLP